MIEWDGGSNPRQTSFKARHCNSVGAALQRMATPSKAQPGARADTAICGIDVGTMASCVALARSRQVEPPHALCRGRARGGPACGAVMQLAWRPA